MECVFYFYFLVVSFYGNLYSMKKSKIKFLILLTVFLDIIGLGIIIPVLPFYVQSFGAHDIVVTLLFTVYALLSFFSAPLLGSLSDSYGRRPILIISIISSAIGWFVFGFAGSIAVLFIGRIIDGIAAGNITTAQSLLADISETPTERSANMGLVGAMFGIGFIIGPVIGGYLGGFGTTVPFYFVGTVSTINAVLAYLWLPETHTPTRLAFTWKKLNPFTPIIDGFRTDTMRSLFGLWFLFGVGIAIQQSIFALYVARVFHMTAQNIGLFFGLVGILILINQMVFMKRIWLRYFSSRVLTIMMLGLFTVGMFAMATPILALFIIGVVCATLSQGTLRGVLGGSIARNNPDKRGEYLGISNAIMSLSMVVGPLLATAVYGYHATMPFIIAGIIVLVSMVTVRFIRWTTA